MVTAEEVYNNELRKFCGLFGFTPMEKYLRIKQIPKDVVFMYSLLSTNGFYKDVLSKEGSFDMRDAKKIRKLREIAKGHIKSLVGGTGELNWQRDKHEVIYQILQVMTKDQAIKIFWHPEFISDDELREAMPAAWRSYIPAYVPVLKFIAFIKFIYPEWIELVKRCRKICLEHKELKKTGYSHLPWHWKGKIDDEQHAAIIHESIHCILRNRGVDKVFDHDAYREGIDVFFHRKSGLFLGYYNKHFWSGRDIKNYWQASEFFWKELENIKNPKEIPKILLNPNDVRVRRIAANIRAAWPSSKDFHA